MQDEPEVLMIMKSTGSCLDATRAMLSLHSCETPEMVALPIAYGHDADLRWVDSSTRTAQA